MAQADVDRLLRARVTAFLDELSTLVRRVSLEAVLETLEGADAAPARPATQRRGRGPARAARAGVREGGAALEARLLEYVAQHPGQRTEEIARGLAVQSSALKPLTKRLCAEQRLKTTGARRGTKYFLRGAAPAARKARNKRTASKPTAKQPPVRRSRAARKKKKAAKLPRSARKPRKTGARKLPQKSVVSVPRATKPTRMPRVKPVTAQAAPAESVPVAVAQPVS